MLPSTGKFRAQFVRAFVVSAQKGKSDERIWRFGILLRVVWEICSFYIYFLRLWRASSLHFFYRSSNNSFATVDSVIASVDIIIRRDTTYNEGYEHL
jgi:hypothetical protein